MAVNQSPTAPSAGRSTDTPGEADRPILGRSAIEVHSIDWVPPRERHGKVWQQGPFWFLGNFQPFTVAIGLIGPGMGLSIGWTSVAAITGILFGTIFMAFHASQGPRMGLPQMVQSRAQFGYRGVVIVLFATLFTFVGFNVVDTVILDSGLKGIFGWNETAVGIIIAVVATALAIYGHDWLHIAFRILFWVSLPFWAILTVAILFGGAGGHVPAHPGGFVFSAFAVQFTAAASYNITYAPYVSDYSRYLPQDTRLGGIVTAVFSGAAGSPIWLLPIGAWLGSRLGATDPLAGVHTAGNNVFGGLGTILTVLGVLALVATMGLNAYSGMLTVVTGIDSIRRVATSRALRTGVIVVLAVAWVVVGVGLVNNATTALNDSLLIMLYLLAPWTAINLLDFFLVRHGHYAITDIFDVNGVYGAWAWRGIVCYLVGVAVEVPFMDLSFYTGPVATAFNGVDISFIVGMVVAGILYVIVTRSLDLAAEAPAIAASNAELAGS
jgi:NCS1 family nucleobase:cation symporter-1